MMLLLLCTVSSRRFYDWAELLNCDFAKLKSVI